MTDSACVHWWISNGLTGKTDQLTIVPQRWLSRSWAHPAYMCCSCKLAEHSANSTYPPMDWTLWDKMQVIFYQTGRPVSKADVWVAVKMCEVCQSINPVPVHWQKGKLNVKDNWNRLVVDIIYHNSGYYLTLIPVPRDLPSGVPWVSRIRWVLYATGANILWAWPTGGDSD